MGKNNEGKIYSNGNDLFGVLIWDWTDGGEVERGSSRWGFLNGWTNDGGIRRNGYSQGKNYRNGYMHRDILSYDKAIYINDMILSILVITDLFLV